MKLRHLTLLPILCLAACATQPSWSPSSSNRVLGVARVAYEYSPVDEPTMSDAQAAQLAVSRCAAWGYARAEMIPGELRDCSVSHDDSCALWKVTREYQCAGAGSYAQAASR